MDQEIVHEPTIDSVRKMAADADRDATDDEIQTAYDMVLDNWKMQIEDAVLDRYRRTSKIDAVEWEELQGEIQKMTLRTWSRTTTSAIKCLSNAWRKA